MVGPRLLKTGPRLLKTGPRLLKTGPRLLKTATQQTRSLHVTGSATFSNLLNSERHALNFPRDVAGLQQECQKRKLPTSGSLNELLNRLTAHEMASSRAFSTINSKRPAPPTTSGTAPRYFNTSRSLKAVNDTSTIDFAHMPDFDPYSGSAPIVRVPILPQTESSEAAKVHTAADGEDAGVVPTVTETIEVSEGILSTLKANLGFAVTESKEPGMAKELWTEFLKDSFGAAEQAKAKAHA